MISPILEAVTFLRNFPPSCSFAHSLCVTGKAADGTLWPHEKWIIHGASLTYRHDEWAPAALPLLCHLLAHTFLFFSPRRSGAFVPFSEPSSILHEIIWCRRGDMWCEDPRWLLNFSTASRASECVGLFLWMWAN